ncbi:hypothetical protein, partial [Bartonella sp. CL27QHWL]|uniref:hypothetical protein n=1 Tax=Bartonella sp. CL27QHWL TaxID=3243521 RepID=UPI0035CE9197
MDNYLSLKEYFSNNFSYIFNNNDKGLDLRLNDEQLNNLTIQDLTNVSNFTIKPKMKEYDISTSTKGELCRNCKRWTLFEYTKNLNPLRCLNKVIKYQFCTSCNSSSYDNDFNKLEISF